MKAWVQHQRCHYCGNHGVRNGTYCTCSYGTSLKIRNGHHERNPQFEKMVRKIMQKYDQTFKRLAKGE